MGNIRLVQSIGRDSEEEGKPTLTCSAPEKEGKTQRGRDLIAGDGHSTSI